MPTIIAYDVSLSMQRCIPGRSEDNAITYQQLAIKGITQLLEYMTSNSKLEYVALVTYSTVCEVKVDFTRDYDAVRQAVKGKVESADKVCLISLLKSVAGNLSTNWGAQNYCQVVIFTDCGLGFGSTALKGFIQSYVTKEQQTEAQMAEYAWISSLKPVKLNFVCMGLHSDHYFQRAVGLYQQLLDFTGLKGQLYMTKPPKESANDVAGVEASVEGKNANNAGAATVGAATAHSTHSKSELGRTAMFELVERVCEQNFKPYEASLKCGGYFRLECPILIWPPPAPYQESGTDKQPQCISHKLEVCGYLALSEIGSPASLSRHLIVPKVEQREKPNRRSSEKSTAGSVKCTVSNSTTAGVAPTKLDVNQPNYEYEKLEQDIRDFYTKEAKDTDESGDDAEAATTTTKVTAVTSESQKESMCVLLHGALKVENLAALVLLSDNWYGFIYSYADSKKKSNLMLNILPPGTNCIPWLGDLNMLGFQEDLLPGETSCTFPVKAEKRASYSQNCVVWIKHVSLQSDVQKVLRHAKKMPEKTQNFYKELNRIRRAALSIGFVELLEALATLFEKESVQLAGAISSSNPECCLQLKHAAIELRKPSNRDLKVSIVPVVNKFAGVAPPGDGSAGASTSNASLQSYAY